MTHYAIPAAIFFGILAWALITLGGNVVQSLTLISLFLGGVGQFMAQSDDRSTRLSAFYICIVAIVLSFGAIFALLLTR